MDVNGQRYEVGYWPGDSHSGIGEDLSVSITVLVTYLLMTRIIHRACNQLPTDREPTALLSILWGRFAGICPMPMADC
jgi:hypothetical protein